MRSTRVLYGTLGLALLMLAACANDEDEAAFTLSGTVAIPHHAVGHPLLIFAGGRGQIYGLAGSHEDGSFTIKVSLPENPPPRILLAAADPANPEAQAWALVDLASTAEMDDGLSQLRRSPPTPVKIDGTSTASALVAGAVGESYAAEHPLARVDTASVSAVDSDLEAGFTPLCSVPLPTSINDTLAALEQIGPETFGQRLDRYSASGGESLLDRLRAGQLAISSMVTSSNDMDFADPGEVLHKFFVVNSYVKRTRDLIEARTTLSGDGFGENVHIPRSELTEAARIIFDQGWGNCREKGLAGAFLASRFADFKQIAVVGIDDSHWDDHAIAIACTKDDKVFDLSSYGTHSGGIAPPAMLAADCYVIDPWLGETAPFSAEYAAEKGWSQVVDLLTIRDDAQPTQPSVPKQNVPVCQVNNPPPDPCQPFELPPELVPETAPTTPPEGVTMVGSCQSPEGYECVILYSVAMVRDQYRASCTAASQVWSDGPCPTTNALAACTLFEGQPLMVTHVFYLDPEEEDIDKYVAELQADCVGIPQESGGPGKWQQPYRPPQQ